MKNIACRYITAVFFLACVFCRAAEARIQIPGRTDSPVNDYAGILNNGTREFVFDTNRKIAAFSSDSPEIIVSTFPSLEGWDVEDFSGRYGSLWRSNRKGKRDNTIIILLVMDERAVDIDVGKNLKNIIPPEVITYLNSEVLEPNFRDKDFSRGIYITVYTLAEIIGSKDIPRAWFSPLKMLTVIAVLCGSVLFFMRMKAFA